MSPCVLPQEYETNYIDDVRVSYLIGKKKVKNILQYCLIQARQKKKKNQIDIICSKNR